MIVTAISQRYVCYVCTSMSSLQFYYKYKHNTLPVYVHKWQMIKNASPHK